jgi:hypothetical protein
LCEVGPAEPFGPHEFPIQPDGHGDARQIFPAIRSRTNSRAESTACAGAAGLEARATVSSASSPYRTGRGEPRYERDLAERNVYLLPTAQLIR